MDLENTRWRLVHFQSSDDAIGTVIPPRVERYTMAFGADGRLELQLDCNRASAAWTSDAAGGQGGSLSIRAGAVTRAACGPGALDTRIAADLARVRSYVIADGNLALALEADAGIYLWEPAPGE
jgi:heat shock protein HslJ